MQPSSVPRESGRAYLPSSHAGWTQSASRMRLEDTVIPQRLGSAAAIPLRRLANACAEICTSAAVSPRPALCVLARRLRQDASSRPGSLRSLDKPSTSHPKITVSGLNAIPSELVDSSGRKSPLATRPDAPIGAPKLVFRHGVGNKTLFYDGCMHMCIGSGASSQGATN